MSDASPPPPPLAPVAIPKDNTVRNVLLVLATILTLSICYYILGILPRDSRARLEFEKLKYDEEKAAQKKAKEDAEELRSANELAFMGCEVAADTKYWDYIKLNKTSSRPGDKPGITIYNAPHQVWEAAARDKKEALAECQRKWGNR